MGMETLLGKIFRKSAGTKWKMLVSLCAVYAASVAVIVLLLSYVIPGIIRNIGDLIKLLPGYYDKLDIFYKNVILKDPLFSSAVVQNAINTQFTAWSNGILAYLQSIAVGIVDFSVDFVSFVFIAVISLVLSFYLLNERENIVSSCSRLLQARLGEKRSSSVIDFLNSLDRVFGRYISAKLLICIIIFVISFVAFSILGIPYSILMSTIVALSTLVPFIGPFVGAVPPIVIALLDSPQKALYAAIALVVIHLVDGYVIEPVVIGEKMGLSPFWILFSIILGGGLFGLWGVLLAVPVAAVLKLLIGRYIKRRQQRRNSELQGEGGGPAQ
jgi:predicted PurR-regulated permease PerM